MATQGVGQAAGADHERPVAARDLQRWKRRGTPFAMLTAYDSPTAHLVESAGIPVILVGDTVGDNVLGYGSTVPVDLETMLHHASAVVRGCERALVVGDLPFGAYGINVEQGLAAGVRLLQEAGVRAVKAEGGGPTIELARRSVDLGIPFMGHLGLTPQAVHQQGYRVQGRDEVEAERLLADALELEQAGAFALVLEAVPAELARRITERLIIPTIGIGAGPHTDGQVLVLHDVLGLSARTPPRFAKRYADVADVMLRAMTEFRQDVESHRFPADEHSYR